MAKAKKRVNPAKKILKNVVSEKSESSDIPVIDIRDIPFATEEYNNLPSDFVIGSQWALETRNRKVGETPDRKSVTVPGESMTVKELLKRHASGRPLPSGRNPIYDSENTIKIPDLERMDRLQLASLEKQMQEMEWEHEKKRIALEKELAEQKDQRYKQMELEFEKLKKDNEILKTFKNDNNTPNVQKNI